MRIRITLLYVLLGSSLPVYGETTANVKAAVAPEYPAIAVVGRVSGVVTIRVVVDESGTVTDASVVQGHPMLKNAALVAAKQWRFAPALPSTVYLKFDFSVLPEKAVTDSQITFLPPDEIEVRKRPPESNKYTQY